VDIFLPMRTSDFYFDLPRELIAQEPLPERSSSRMMVLHRDNGELEHKHVMDLPAYLKAGDLLVVNDTRVIPARVFGRRIDTGGKVELLLLEKVETGDSPVSRHYDEAVLPFRHEETWDAFYRASGKPKIGMHLRFAGDKLDAEVVSIGREGRIQLTFKGKQPVLEILEEEGFAPVPPYIRRPAQHTALTKCDRQRYQTIYARYPGAVAAPTAGLHFTPELLNILENKGIKRTSITLHVGPGTFKPVKTAIVEDHTMEAERYEVTDKTAELIESTKKNGNKVAAVGSTTVRTLETIMRENNSVVPCSGRTSLFIYPPYHFRVVDIMLTNFHLPESSLLMMVSAFAGRDAIMNAYTEAVAQKYRFYSYGDCMLIL
jgi:S-adenosylmethionine:tRNA ribosyltransferase-isomerase